MFCTKCGNNNSDSAAFCTQCGTPIAAQSTGQQQVPPQQQAAGYYQQPQYPPAGYQQYPPLHMQKPKKKSGLIAGLIIGGILLLAAAAAAVYFFVLGSPDGKWYNAERGIALSFDGNSAVRYSLTGTSRMTLEYNKISGEGSLASGGSRNSFKLADQQLELDADGRTIVFEKLEKSVDIEEKVLEALNGIWVCEEAVKALEFKDGKATVYSSYGEQTGSYTYDIDDGTGKLKIDGTDLRFSATYQELSFDTEVYTKESKNFDIGEFISKNNTAILGTWYEKTGQGSISFLPDGTMSISYQGETITGTYTYDSLTNSGTVTVYGQTTAFILQNDVLIIEDVEFTRTEQPVIDTLSPIVGTWYETTGLWGTIYFYDDGSADLYINNQFYYCTYTYNNSSSDGQLTIHYADRTDAKYFWVYDGVMYLDGYAYTQTYVQPATGVTGTWYSVTGKNGIFTFDGYGGVYLEYYGNIYYGSYTFDTLTNTGSLTLVFAVGESETIDFYLSNGEIIVDGEVFVRNYVEQTYDSPVAPTTAP